MFTLPWFYVYLDLPFIESTYTILPFTDCHCMNLTFTNRSFTNPTLTNLLLPIPLSLHYPNIYIVHLLAVFFSIFHFFVPRKPMSLPLRLRMFALLH